MKIAGGDKNDGGRKWIEAKPTAAETSTKNSAAATGYGRSGGGKAAERTTPARRSRSGESVGRSCGLPYHIAANASPTPRLSQGAVPAPDPPPPPFPRTETFEQPSFRPRAGIRNREPRDDTAWTRCRAWGVMQRSPTESTAGGRRWVPVCTGTTEGGGAPTSSFPRRETFAQPSFPRRRESRFGFPARNASHLRHAVSHRGSYAKVSGRGNLSPTGCTNTTLDAVHHSGGTNQVANLGSRRPVWRSTSHGASPGR